MTPDERLEPIRDEYGGVWQFYKGEIPGTEFELSFTLQLPAGIHNYIVERYVGTDEQGPLPQGFRFTPEMMENISRQWEAMKGEWPLDMEAFRAAVEEVANHRYYIESDEHPFDFDSHVEQRESVVNEPLDDINWFQGGEVPDPLLDDEGKPIDIEQLYQEWGPEHDDDEQITPDLLEPVPLNFSEYINNVSDYMAEKAMYMRERTAEFTQDDTFGR
jgi:hypothetical protein